MEIQDKENRLMTPTSRILQNIVREDGCSQESSSHTLTDDEMAWHKTGPQMSPSSPELYQAINVIPTYLLDAMTVRVFEQI